MSSRLNAEWHRAHRMAPKATLEERLEWHVEHQKHCACRDLPAGIRAELARRGTVVVIREAGPEPGS